MSKILFVVLVFILVGCTAPTPHERGAQLFNNYCASCHSAPSPQDLPRDIWAKNILPEMGARLGIRDSGYDPYKRITFMEKSAIKMAHIYPEKPLIAMEDWELLKKYVLDLAPDSLNLKNARNNTSELSQFSPKAYSVDSIPGSFITFIQYDESSEKLNLGNTYGDVFSYDFEKKQAQPIGKFGNNIVAFTDQADVQYATSIGQLRPSELPSGRIYISADNKINRLPQELHRPVHTLVIDLDNDGTEELVVSEFGYFTGDLALFSKDETNVYNKKIVLGQPGTNRVIARDMNGDDKLDLIVQTAQGDEGITILYQQNNLEFKAEKVIQVSPAYGSSWFELIDYNGDGHDDIVTTNGDNADNSRILKPYHGLRIYLNDGNNHFNETHFYPMYGATRLVASDFDEDGDIDFGILSTFPDYEDQPKNSFVYLENENATSYKFKPYTFEDSQLGQWFLMDAGDVDHDGDKDIILSALSNSFTKIPDSLSKIWYENAIDIMLLKNNLKD